MLRQKLDCLFIHVPQDNSDNGCFAMSVAMGVFALADKLRRNGYSSRILNLGVEKILDNGFSIERYLEDKDILSIGISLHWHYQSDDCIRLVNTIKSVRPDIKIILGGFTASFFSNEIMENNKNVDFIIRGEAEIPLLDLLKAISSNEPEFSSIPNLTWRNRGEIIHNELDYIASEDDLNKLNFTNFELMEHFSAYSRTSISIPYYSKDLLAQYNTFPLCIGRGCPVNCTFCGGSRMSQQVINKRNRVIFRSHEAVLESIKDAVQAGIDCLYISFDPDPNKKYYRELFRVIRNNSINLSMVFECWSIPTFDFIDDFSETFGKGKHSIIVISPETASEKLRKRHKGFYYTNNELMGVLRYLKEKEIFTEVYFSYPLPYENIDDVNETIDFMEQIHREIGNHCKVLIQDFDFDPASPMFLNPEENGITRIAESFSDYCRIKTGRKFLLRDLNEEEFNRIYNKYSTISKMDNLFSNSKVCLKLKRYEEAASEARKVIELAPEKVDAYLLLGSCYEETKNYESALEVYEEALKISPDEGVIHIGLARVQLAMEHFQEAITEVDRARKLNYREDNVHFLLGYCYERTGRFEEAIEELRKAEGISPVEPQISFSLSNCYRLSGQIEQADKELDNALLKLKNPNKCLL